MKAITAHPEPYAGLRVYLEKDAAIFFGRGRLRDVIISNLRSSRLTLLFGPSGVGKSSVIHAGVAYELMRVGRENVDENGVPELAVAVFSNWRDDPVAGLIKAVEDAATQALGGRPLEPLPPSNSLAEKLGACAERVGGDLLVILDQFEDYFLDREYDEDDGGFAHELARMVNRPGLRVNFLLSIRDDAYSKLERLKSRISNIYANALRIEHLDIEAASQAIKKPLDQYNKFYAAGDERVSIEPELVEEVLRSVRTGRLSLGDVGRGVMKRAGAAAEREASIEAPFLQLVMTELWRAEMRAGSTTLRLQTLKNLGGADQIVRTHLAQVMEGLSEAERDMAASAFNFLVTSSGNKIPYTTSDLAESAKLDRNKLVPLLEKLTGSGRRILRASAPTRQNAESRYEFAHDVLAKAAFAWRTKYRDDQKIEEEKRRAAEKAKADERERWEARLRWARRGSIFVFVLIAVSLVYAQYQRITRNALRATTVSSDILNALYQVILQPDDSKTSAENLGKTLDMLYKALDAYQADGNPAGEGIVHNQIGGVFREMGRSAAGSENYQAAKNYYQHAEEDYEKARQILQNALGPDHTDVANSLDDLAYVYILSGKYSQAEPLFKQALSIKESALESDSRFVADTQMNLAECYDFQGKYDEAERLYKCAVNIRTSKADDNRKAAAQSLSNLAFLYLERGKYAEAERRFNEALDVWKTSTNPQELDAVPIYNGLAAIYGERGDYERAYQYLGQVQVLHKEPKQYDHLLEADDDENLALLRSKQDNPGAQAETEHLFEEVIRIRFNALGGDHPDTAIAASNLALFYLTHGKQKAAESILNKARTIQEALPHSPALARTLRSLARLYTDQEKYDYAEPLFKKAIAIQEKAIPEHPDFADTLAAYAGLLGKTDRNAAAEGLKKRAEQIRQAHADENRCD